MADRYWVSVSAANWDASAGTKWSATNGGAGGASVPTTADRVFFTSSSGANCTIADGNTGAASINCTGYTKVLTMNSATTGLTVAGSMTLVSGMTFTHTAGTITFTGSGTLTSASKTLSAITINGAGITVQLGDALNISGRNITLTAGTFTTNNYTVTAGTLLSSNANTRAINLGSSTVSLSSTSGGASIDFNTITNLTFNADTSQIALSASSARLEVAAAGLTFYNVSFTGTGTGTKAITGTNTFNNLTLQIGTTNSIYPYSIFANQTVNGTLTCSSAIPYERPFLHSDTMGTTRTITANAIAATNCDFRDITIAGSAAGSSPTGAGNCGGNSGVNFPAAKTVYRVGTNTTWEGSNSWALTSGGTGADANFPLAQDTAVINNSTTLTGTLSIGNYNIGGLDCSARTTGITLSHGTSIDRYGSYILGSGVTVSGTSAQTFAGRGTYTFTSAGKTITFFLNIEAPGGTLQLGDALNSSSSLQLIQGTFSAVTYNVTCTKFISNDTTTRTLNMGSGLWTITDVGTTTASPWYIINGATLTLNKETANILLSSAASSARSFIGGSKAYNKLTIGGLAGNTTQTITNGKGSFTEIASTRTGRYTLLLDEAGTDEGDGGGDDVNRLKIGTWSVKGADASTRVIVRNTDTSGETDTWIALTNVTSGIDFLEVQGMRQLANNTFYVGANSINNGSNTRIIFTAAPGDVSSNSNFFLMFG